MRIVLDAYGGDNAPIAPIEGAIKAVSTRADLYVTLVGKQDELSELLSSRYNGDKITVLNAQDVITNDDAPVEAVRNKPDSSIVVAYNELRLKDDADALISAGSTGALLAGGIFKLGRIKGVSRPALAPVLPTVTGGNVILVDAGANVDCAVKTMSGFATMGSIFMQKVYGIATPRVALLSNGTEEHKGNVQTQEAFAALSQLPINFVGNMEARDLLAGTADVIVADGFYGNVALKSLEGMAGTIFALLKQGVGEGGFSAKIGALLLKKTLRKVKNQLDYTKRGGAILLGLKKPVLKTHGASNSEAFCSTILQAAGICDSKLTEVIAEALVKQGAGDEA